LPQLLFFKDTIALPSDRNSLILGVSSRLRPSLIEPFVRSLRATSYKGTLGLVLANYNSEEYTLFATWADMSVCMDDVFDPPPRFLVDVLQLVRTTRLLRRLYRSAFRLATHMTSERHSQRHWETLEYHLEGLQSLRYSIYYDFLTKVAPTASEILLTDMRDVLFQDDPFARPVTGLEVALEPESHTFGRDAFNGRWIRDLAGPAQVGQMKEKVASCSGTVIAPRAPMLHYLREMSAAIAWRRCAMGPHDQGVHNLLLHNGRLPHAQVIPNGYGRVLTMGGMASYELDELGHVMNLDGSVPAIIHQYDRHPGLAQVLWNHSNLS
jgi:hypothetical protein